MQAHHTAVRKQQARVGNRDGRCSYSQSAVVTRVAAACEAEAVGEQCAHTSSLV
jgi:hypothetical protein